MAKTNKTIPTEVQVLEYLNEVEPEKRRVEGLALNEIFKEATGEIPRMWGPSIIGYGTYHYKYESGREGDSLRSGYSPRKGRISIYIMGKHERYKELFDKLGKYKTGKSCVYVNKLADIDKEVLKKLIKASYDYIGNKVWP